MMSRRWIKLFQKLLYNPIFKDSELLHLFIFCLLKANYEPKEWTCGNQVVHLKVGQFATGLHTITAETGIKQTTAYRKMKTLQKLGVISVKAENKFSVVTVIKYSSYQEQRKADGKETEKKWKTNGKQMETALEVIEEIESIEVLPQKLHSLESCLSVALYEGYSKDEGQKFFDFYNSQGWKRGKSQALITDLVSAFRSWISRAGEMGLTPSKAGKLNQTNL